MQRLSEASTLQHAAGASQLVFFVGADKKSTLGDLVTRDFFPGIRPRLALGRGFSESEHDEQGEPVVVISWQYWHDELGGRPDVLGTTLQIDTPAVFGTAEGSAEEGDIPPLDFRIVGVLHRTFAGTEPPTQLGMRSSFWIPVAARSGTQRHAGP